MTRNNVLPELHENDKIQLTLVRVDRDALQLEWQTIIRAEYF